MYRSYVISRYYGQMKGYTLKIKNFNVYMPAQVHILSYLTEQLKNRKSGVCKIETMTTKSLYQF